MENINDWLAAMRAIGFKNDNKSSNSCSFTPAAPAVATSACEDFDFNTFLQNNLRNLTAPDALPALVDYSDCEGSDDEDDGPASEVDSANSTDR